MRGVFPRGVGFDSRKRLLIGWLNPPGSALGVKDDSLSFLEAPGAAFDSFRD
jgi:hypothetical protein